MADSTKHSDSKGVLSMSKVDEIAEWTKIIQDHFRNGEGNVFRADLVNPLANKIVSNIKKYENHAYRQGYRVGYDDGLIKFEPDTNIAEQPNER
jgi:hypothetical protein